MKTPITLLILLVILGLSACKKSAEYEPVSKSAGYFILTPMQSGNGLKSGMKQSSEDPPRSFDLGDIKDSREFYFILTNGGEEPIFDI